MLVAQLCLSLCNPMDCSPPSSSARGILKARILEWTAFSLSPKKERKKKKNTGMGCHALLQRIFPTQGSNPHLLRTCLGKQILYY